MVGMRLKRGGGELLNQAADGIAVRAQAALFDYNVALLVKLAHHGMEKALGLKVGPQFQPILGQGIVVGGFVFAGVGVHVFAAVLLDDLAEFVGLDEFVGGGNGVFPFFFQLLQLCFVAAHALVVLAHVGGVSGLNLGQSGLFSGIVGGADFVSALERHVFEHVRHARLAHGILHRAGVDQRKEREDGSLGPLADDQGQAIWKLFDRDALGEGGDILGGAEGGKK